MYSRGRLLFLARSRLLFITQKEFLKSLCKPNPKIIDPKNWAIPVVTAPRGFRKTTTAKEVADASNGTIRHITQDDLKAENKSLWDYAGADTISASVSTFLGFPVPASVLKYLLALKNHPKVMQCEEKLRTYKWIAKYMSPKLECTILDDLMGDIKFEKNAPPDEGELQLRTFLTKLRSRLPKKYFVIITSNEGFRECIYDSTTADDLIEIFRFPPPTVSELAAALKDALQDRVKVSTVQAFRKVPAQITSDLINEELVANVVEQLPIRHGCSMRVWGLLLSHIDANTPPEALSAAVIETLKDENFLLSVVEEVDLKVAQLSSINGLLKSEKMLEVEIKKLANLLNLTLTPTAPLKVPGRLVLISLLKMAKVRDAEYLHDRLEEKQVRPAIGRIIEDFEGRC